MTRRRTRFMAGDDFRAIAAERVERLLGLAEASFQNHPDFLDRYVQLAWRLKTRYNLKLPPHLKRKFCRKCLSFWRPGVSCRVRIKRSGVTITCLRCGRVIRLPFESKKQYKKNKGGRLRLPPSLYWP